MNPEAASKEHKRETAVRSKKCGREIMNFHDSVDDQGRRFLARLRTPKKNDEKTGLACRDNASSSTPA